ncbi:MAG: hypothetical protein ACP5G0_09895 [Desulfomonilia bacterium]
MMRTCFFALIFVTLLVPCAFAQRVHIDIQAQSFKKFKVAMPAYAGQSDLATTLWSACAQDIRVSGVFDLLDPRGYINPGPLAEIAPGTLKDWSLIGADYVISGSVSRGAGSVAISVQVIELSTAEVILNTRYQTAETASYRAIHAFMDALLERSLGLEPMFSSKIVAIRSENGKKQLFVSWCDGAGGNTIRGGGNLVLNPAWSHDGKRIAFVSYWRNNPDLYLLDVASNKVRLVSGLQGINITPSFDRTCARLACTLSIDGNPEIYLLDLSGPGRIRLTDSWATDTSPSISPDGTQLVFCSSRAGSPQIYLMDISTKKVQRVTYEGGYNTEPVFSPKGGLVAFTHLASDRRYHIALIRPDGTSMKVLPGTGLGDESPTFSPDGRLVAFAASDGNIYVSDFMGISPARITDGGGYTEPCWSGVMK